jgi:hypothetical protein
LQALRSSGQPEALVNAAKFTAVGQGITGLQRRFGFFHNHMILLHYSTCAVLSQFSAAIRAARQLFVPDKIWRYLG